MAEISHPTDQELFLAIEGEAAEAVQEHVAACGECRARMEWMEGQLEVRSQEPEDRSAAQRALLVDRMAKIRAARSRWRWVAACAAVLVAAIVRQQPGVLAEPKRELTPGVAVVMNREQVCAARAENNRMVPAALQRRVFEEYGMARAPVQAYEVDYLITPALGGADDIHNLWPQPYHATVWNARVKDELEDRLREMVCAGDMELATAQREIAEDWIAAYKRHFHTDRPRLSGQ